MKRLLSRMGLLGVFIMSAVAGQVFFASPAFAIQNPSFDWEESYTADNKLGELQLTWCSSNLDGETLADIAAFRSGASGQYVTDCLNKSVGGICNTVEKGAEEEYRCFRTIPDDHPLVLAIKAAEKNEVGPLQVLYCGTPNNANADRLIACQQAVSKAYFSPKCFYSNQRDSNAGRSSAPDAASCVRDALRNNDAIINKNRTQAQVLTAIRQGRKAANTAIQAAIKTDQARLQCIENKGRWENGACVAEGEGGAGSNEPVCSAGALGWIICPLTDFISDATQTIAEIIEGQLVYPALLNSAQGDAIRVIWGTVLGIANLGLVIVFLFIIFSQATSVGLSSYGVKKILPRLIAAAILMNLSFFLCAIAVDLANILGVSIKGIVQAGIESIDKAAPASDLISADGTSWAAGVVGILGLGIAAFTGSIAFLLPVIVAALIAVFTAFLVIAARGVIVTLLIIVAPIAFLAWILPNTEQWFTKWRKLFTSMLLLFPLVMLVFYGSLLVSKLVLVTSTGGSDGDPKIMTNIIALGILTVPLFSLPFIMKAAGGVLDRFGVLVNNRSKGIVDRSRKKASELQGRTSYQRGRELRKRAADEYRGTKFANRVGKGGATGILARGVGGNLGRLPGAKDSIYGAQSTRLQAYAVQAEREAATKRRQSIGAALRSEGVDMHELKDRYQKSVNSGDVDSANAQITHLATTFGAGGRQLAAEALSETRLGNISDQGKRDKMRTELNETIGGELYGSLIGSRADIAKGGFRSEKDAAGKVVAGSENSFGFTDISKLTAPQITTQDKGVHEMGKARGQAYDASETYIAATNGELISKITDTETRKEISRRSGVPLETSPSAGGASTASTTVPPGAAGGLTGGDTGPGGLWIPNSKDSRPPSSGNDNSPPRGGV